LEYADGWRSGGDIAVENFGVVWPFLPNQLRSLAARLPYCQVIACDVDPPILRTLPVNEVEFGLWTVAFAGGGLFLSDNLEVLPPDRLAPGTDTKLAALALSGQIATPQSMFPPNPPPTLSSALADTIAQESTAVLPVTWNLQGGQQVLMNPGDVTLTVGTRTVPPHSAKLLSPL
jgi:hypothetical protein